MGLFTLASRLVDFVEKNLGLIVVDFYHEMVEKRFGLILGIISYILLILLKIAEMPLVKLKISKILLYAMHHL